MEADELLWLTWMTSIAKHDRDAYRELRKEAWELYVRDHAAQTSAERDQWLEKAS